MHCLLLPDYDRYVQVQNVTSLAARKSMGQSNGVIDSVLLEAGQPGGDVAGEHVVYLEMGVDWTSYRSKVRRSKATGTRRDVTLRPAMFVKNGFGRLFQKIGYNLLTFF